MKEAYLYKKLSNKNVQCQNCPHFCIIAPGKRGLCGVRKNINGKLYALNYGKAIAVNIDPIEKKPFFHFLPGSYSLSIATVGCNLKCKSCQNWNISQMPQLTGRIEGENLPPEEVVKMALKNNLPSISYTYVEPTIFLEYGLDTMKLAKKAGLKNCFVSNGFMSEEAAKLIIPYLDANNVDIKGFSDEFYQKVCGGRLQPVLDTAKLMKKSGVWVEITTLAIPGLSDSEKMFRGIAKFIYKELGAETPWHISQFSGAISWKLQSLPDTSIKTLQKAWKIGKEAGLKYVYTGNVPGLPSENTFCPKCGTLCIDRKNYIIHRHDKAGKCPKCGEDLNIIG
ncbi:MAG: AmmeMemoRadiSam system radical SAM enzyme [Candidatus Nealsonbacteria bacterium CG08_land_8_20_14_0_20_38_20]|uniref:AmmeMemoRadiSam system radical SAM enzyme n=1 Tax=Candidatus Nealsonbacteria bacterium CG08_land_8_20_14_0_20_38_20 TaxID=1974705 RepID=A0A2H0YLX7_9BACT|nr:MAG: AmmeMemoRadiSam system radical SAM enzyme [Candidatus Nealsonbacteria bacterium CG08_land_8_20_14_0_20_38_20]